VTALVLYTLISAACFYLGSRARITHWLWSKYPPKLASFMDCSACTGFWYGALAALVFRASYLGLDPTSYYTPIAVGLCSLVLTPIAAGIMQAGLDHLGSAVESTEEL
jgi:hypothetical protein